MNKTLKNELINEKSFERTLRRKNRLENCKILYQKLIIKKIVYKPPIKMYCLQNCRKKSCKHFFRPKILRSSLKINFVKWIFTRSWIFSFFGQPDGHNFSRAYRLGDKKRSRARGFNWVIFAIITAASGDAVCYFQFTRAASRCSSFDVR